MVKYVCCCFPIRNGKGVNDMCTLFSFLLSVAAGVIAGYICKWLDQKAK